MTLNNQTNQELRLHGTFLRDLSFENPHMPYKMQGELQPKIDISYGIEVNSLQENFYDVALKTYISSTINEESLFIIDLSFAGIFNVEISDDSELEKILYVHCAQVLHPFVRSIISNLALDGGLPPLLLQPVDFLNLYLEKKNADSSFATAPVDSEMKN